MLREGAALPRLSDSGRALEQRGHRNRDCFAPASLAFRRRPPVVPVGACGLDAFRLTLGFDQVGATGGGDHGGGVLAIRALGTLATRRPEILVTQSAETGGCDEHGVGATPSVQFAESVDAPGGPASRPAHLTPRPRGQTDPQAES